MWLDDDVEVFVAGPDAYYELEINALGTVYEVLFAWDDVAPSAAFGDVPALHRDHPLAAPFDGVGFRHPRGPRTGFWGFDLPGLRTATGWSVEIAIPGRGLAPIAADGALPPAVGGQWRVALARLKKRRHGPQDSGGWSAGAHGVWDAHIPELFPLVRLVDAPAR